MREITPDQRAIALFRRGTPTMEQVAAAIREAVNERTESCAKVLDEARTACGCPPGKACDSFGCSSLRRIAEAIRYKITK